MNKTLTRSYLDLFKYACQLYYLWDLMKLSHSHSLDTKKIYLCVSKPKGYSRDTNENPK